MVEVRIILPFCHLNSTERLIILAVNATFAGHLSIVQSDLELNGVKILNPYYPGKSGLAKVFPVSDCLLTANIFFFLTIKS